MRSDAVPVLLQYAVWAFIWLCWNIFVICFYLEVGRLRRSDEVLSLYTGSVSFWEASGPGCVPVYSTNGSAPADPYREPRPDRVDGCWLDYEHVEALHAALQILLAAIGVVLAGCLIAARRREDDSSGVKPRSLSPAYHIEYRPHRVEERAGRSSRSNRSRSSQRTRRHPNPVTQLLDSSSSELAPDRGHTNPGFLASERPAGPPRPPSVHSSYSNYHGQRRPAPAVASDYGTTGTLSAPPLPRYGEHADYGGYGRAGPPPYEAVPSLTETSM
ncbi:uncharacterized protein LOC119095664 [Pollicipes pollicipes]|uniref:uncharacterized protein LOC119095664 n=1 Tax=Pollicipes pollicipes TaxID=41117 RepID=UPI001884A2E4|nr:uncharacterized protein LOC119095664 [Pollicipes pollicipes]